MKHNGWYCFAIAAFLLLNPGEAIIHISLNSSEWSVQNSNASTIASASVPGGIYSDLRSAGILSEDNFYRFNDVNYRWVANETWIYSLSFTVNEEFLHMPYKELIFDGIDAISTISLNEVEIGTTNNMFVKYRYSVKNILKANNKLQVTILSPVKTAEELFENSSHVIPPSCVPKDYNGACHVNFLRKMQASFGWDWGPAFPSVGIWKSVTLIGYEPDIILNDILVTTVPKDDVWNLIVAIYLDTPITYVGTFDGLLNITLNIGENGAPGIVSDNISFSIIGKQDEPIVKNLIIKKNQVKIWWPNGFGDQPLYNLTILYGSGLKQQSKSIKIGFRTVELIQDPVTSTNNTKGLTFYYKINDIPIFAKGTNWIPSNILPEKSSDESTVRQLLEAAKISNMNMIRVWGGGLYESDMFYTLCDEYGIMIWQDMMFACSMYPANEEFLSTVSIEIEQQIRRLQYHPSIVIWAGNNENEAALRDNWYSTKKDFDLYKEEYIKLYVDTIRTKVLENDKSRPFIVSSPTNGNQSEIEGYIAENPYDVLYGDIHYYNYLVDSWSSKTYPLPRFASEYGLQSLPSLESLRNVSLFPSDLQWLGTEFLDHRQHLPLGYIFMSLQGIFHYEMPSLTDMEYFIYLSQVNQAWAVKSQTEWYRRNRNTLLPDGKGMTMGALYWQLNDVWQAPSWSSIEYSGKWKMLQYYATKMFAPILISPSVSFGGNIQVSLISDLLYDIENLRIVINVFRWDSIIPIVSIEYHVLLKNQSSVVALNTSLYELYQSAPYCNSDFNFGSKCLYEFQLLNINGDAVSPDNYILPTTLAWLGGYSKPNVTVKVTDTDSSKLSLQHHMTMEVESVALFVWLEATSLRGYFSDNGYIQTIKRKRITFFSRDPITSHLLQSNIKVTIFSKFPVGSHICGQLESSLVNVSPDNSETAKDDWASIFGDFTKFALGMFSVAFDILFILQHFVFNRHNEEKLNSDN